MDHAVGICDLPGQTHTECVAYERMIDGCYVFINANWYLSDVDSGPEVEFHRVSVSVLHRQRSTIRVFESNCVCNH